MVGIRHLVLPALAVLLAGCAPGPAPTEAREFSIADLVAALPPIDGAPLLLSVGDVAAAGDLLDLPRPDAPGDALVDFVAATSGRDSGAPVALPWPETLGANRVSTHDEYVAAVGFGLPDVRAFAWASLPPTSFTLIDGEFDLDAVTAALGDPVDGVWAQPGDDYALDLVDGSPVVDELGRAVRVAGDASRLVLTLDTGLASAYLDGIAGDRPTLLAVARRLDDEGAYAAQFFIDGDVVVAVALVPGDDGSRPLAVRVAPGALPEVGAEIGPLTVTAVETDGDLDIIRGTWPDDQPPVAIWSSVFAFLP